MRRTWLLLALAACGKSESATRTRVPEHKELATTPPSAVPRVAIDVAQGLSSPEAAVWDPDQDVYFISNMNGDPAADDHNGFITKVSPSGQVLAERWIDGTRPGVTLNAPKGMVVSADTLYVVDNHAVRLFDKRTGEETGSWEVPGTIFLNDVAIDGNGKVLATETGIVLAPDGEPVKKAPYKIFRFEDGKPTVIAEGDDLEGPNGIEHTPEGDIVLAFMGKDVYRIKDGKKETIATLPFGKLDGIVRLADGTLLVTSWDGRGIYKVVSGSPPTYAVENLDVPASIGYDDVRHRLLIPMTALNTVRIEDYP